MLRYYNNKFIEILKKRLAHKSIHYLNKFIFITYTELFQKWEYFSESYNSNLYFHSQETSTNLVNILIFS